VLLLLSPTPVRCEPAIKIAMAMSNLLSVKGRTKYFLPLVFHPISIFQYIVRAGNIQIRLRLGLS